MRGIETFDRRNPADFQDLQKKFSLVVRIKRSATFNRTNCLATDAMLAAWTSERAKVQRCRLEAGTSGRFDRKPGSTVGEMSPSLDLKDKPLGVAGKKYSGMPTALSLGRRQIARSHGQEAGTNHRGKTSPSLDRKQHLFGWLLQMYPGRPRIVIIWSRGKHRIWGSPNSTGQHHLVERHETLEERTGERPCWPFEYICRKQVKAIT